MVCVCKLNVCIFGLFYSNTIWLWIILGMILLRYFVDYDLYFYSVLEPVLLKLLTYHLQNTNVDNKTTFVRNGNVSAFFNLLGNVAQNQFVLIQPFIVLILECLSKWGAQFTQLSEFSVRKFL